jgi:ADP-ribosylglycohydrolase
LIGKYQGCLLGLTIGDTLAAPAEFRNLEEIKKRYGRDGIIVKR